MIQETGTIAGTVLLAIEFALAVRLEVPRQHGVVWELPGTIEQTVAQLEQIKADNFNYVITSSWGWTVPRPGSDRFCSRPKTVILVQFGPESSSEVF